MAGRQLLTQLGQEDIILSGDPEITFFKEQYKARSPFASRVTEVIFESPPTFGEESDVDIPLNGDLMTAMYARFDFPSAPSSNFKSYAGLQMINFVELYSGSQLVERLWGEYIGILNACQVPTSKQTSLTSLVGSGTPNAQYTPSSRYTVPLGFQCLKNGLPLVKNMTFRISLNQSTVFTVPPIAAIPSMDFKFLVEFVILGEPERNWMKKRGPVLYLGESVQRAQFDVPAGHSNVRCVTQFLHPVKELFFTIKNTAADNFDYWYNYASSSSKFPWAYAYSNINQLNSLGMYFEGVQKVNPIWATSLYLGTTQFMDYHTRVPVAPFYMYSFSLDPENPKPTGSVNMGRIKNQYFDLFLQPSQQARTVTIWARYYTFLKVDGFETLVNLYDNNGDDGYIKYLN
jgi:Large eukaryotic DNA virus major capsid protein/Major capsid protein N-terminus